MYNAIARHAMDCGHLPNWKKSEVLEKEENITKRKILESLEIKKNKDNFNLDNGIKINSLWNAFF